MAISESGSEPSGAGSTIAPRSSRRGDLLLLLLLLSVVGALWWCTRSGLVSSNDGSHLALARALALRQQTHIDEDVALTLWVDRAHKDGHDYSDRPPGTAWLAMPAVMLGARLDVPLFERSLAAFKAGASQEDALVVQPATRAFADTYGIRMQRFERREPVLAKLQGTVLIVTLHAIAVGLVGLWLLARALASRGVGRAGRAVAVLSLGLATLWGPYSTVLFSHVTAGMLLFGYALLLEKTGATGDGSRARRLGLIAGVLGAWAVAADYALALAVIPLALLTAPRRLWLHVVFGATLVGIALATYHTAAFGAPWRIGYDFQTNFEFARDRAETFGGDWFDGAWTLFGGGRGAGLLVQSPIVLVGLAGFERFGGRSRRMLLGLLPWLLVLPLHQTPWGGATEDHRYLIPLLPFAALGLGLLWQQMVTQRQRVVAVVVGVGLVMLAVVSAVLVWSHAMSWRV